MLKNIWNTYTDNDIAYEIGNDLKRFCRMYNPNINSFDKLINKDDKEKYNELKSTKKIKVYRGQLMSDDIGIGYSWTLNLPIAQFFSDRFNNPFIIEDRGLAKLTLYGTTTWAEVKGSTVRPIIYQAEISNKDLFIYTNERKEEEVFILFPERLNYKELN